MVSEYNLYSMIKRLHTVEKCSCWDCNMKHVSRGCKGVGRGGGVMVFSGDKQTMEYNGDLADTGVEYQRKGTSHAVADQIFPTEEGLPDNTNLILQKI